MARLIRLHASYDGEFIFDLSRPKRIQIIYSPEMKCVGEIELKEEFDKKYNMDFEENDKNILFVVDNKTLEFNKKTFKITKRSSPPRFRVIDYKLYMNDGIKQTHISYTGQINALIRYGENCAYFLEWDGYHYYLYRIKFDTETKRENVIKYYKDIDLSHIPYNSPGFCFNIYIDKNNVNLLLTDSSDKLYVLDLETLECRFK